MLMAYRICLWITVLSAVVFLGSCVSCVGGGSSGGDYVEPTGFETTKVSSGGMSRTQDISVLVALISSSSVFLVGILTAFFKSSLDSEAERAERESTQPPKRR
jgi:endonuclease V-like protein UPF0215 family